jgi:DNA-binding transcriptional MocR family regulator
VINCCRGIPPPEAIPSAALALHAAAALRDAPDLAFQYAPIGHYRGDDALRQQLALLHSADADRIFVGNGSLQVLDLVAGLLLQTPGTDVYVESPTYDRAVRIFARHGARVRGVPVERDGLNIDALDALVRERVPAFVYTIPDFQNPSGVTMSSAKRRALADLASTAGFVIVEDSPYRSLRYRGSTLPAIYQISEPSHIIAINSLAKVLSPGLRIGYAIATPDVVSGLAALAEDTYLSPPPFCQHVAARALTAGLVGENITRCIDIFRPRYEAAVEVVQRRLGDALFAIPEGGYFLAAYVAGHEAQVLNAARSVGVILTAGSAFFPAAQPNKAVFLRLPFQALEPSEFAEAIDRLAPIVQEPAAAIAGS